MVVCNARYSTVQRSKGRKSKHLFRYPALMTRNPPHPNQRHPLRPTFRPRLHQSKPHQTRRSEEHTSELQSRLHLVCRLLLEKKKNPHFSSNSRFPSSFPRPLLHLKPLFGV